MAVTIDTSAQSTKDAVTGIPDTRAVVITVASNTDRALFVCTPIGDATLANRTVNGVSSSLDGAFTHVGSSDADNSNWSRVEWWYLLNPSVGAHTVTVTFASGTTALDSAAALAISLYGVDQTTPVGTPSTDASAASTGGSGTVTLASGDMALGGISSDATTITTTVGTEQQKQIDVATASPDNCYELATNTGTGSVSITFTSGTTGYAISVIPVLQSGGSPPPPPRSALRSYYCGNIS
jgi:hypothetical protein